MDALRHFPSISALHALVEVATVGSFSLAANTLCLTQSAVSRQIQQLEGHYGVPLFIRSSRRLELTAEGEQVLACARAVVEQLKNLRGRLSAHKRPFRIRMHVSLAVRWLLPRLGDFYRRFPDVPLSIETVATEQVEPASDSDAVIVYRAEPLPGDISLIVFSEALIPVCAPALLQSVGALARVEDLTQVALLHGSADQQGWAQWLAANGGKPIDVYRHLPFNLDELALDAAARGLGVAMTDRTLAQESLERGVLVMPFGPPLLTAGAYALVLQPSGSAHPARSWVMEWFAQQAQAPAL